MSGERRGHNCVKSRGTPAEPGREFQELFQAVQLLHSPSRPRPARAGQAQRRRPFVIIPIPGSCQLPDGSEGTLRSPTINGAVNIDGETLILANSEGYETKGRLQGGDWGRRDDTAVPQPQPTTFPRTNLEKLHLAMPKVAYKTQARA